MWGRVGGRGAWGRVTELLLVELVGGAHLLELLLERLDLLRRLGLRGQA